MKQNFTHYFKSIILAIAFLLSGEVPTFGQELYIYDGSGQMKWMANTSSETVEISGSDSFCFAVFTVTGGDRILHYIAKSPSDAVNITTTAYTNNSLTTIYNYEDPNSIDQELLNNIQMFHIPNNEGSVNLCWKYENPTLSIAIHEISKVAKTQNATCREDGYVTYECRQCGKTRTEILNALGHSFGEWQTMEGGRFRTCSHDAGHIQYDMDATGVNALEITLTDETKLSYPSTLSPVVTFNDLDVAIRFDTDKTSLVNKADIKEYNQVWSHNKNGYAQNEDNTYSHACDVAGCTVRYDDLFVKNGEQYYVANKKDGVIKVADMELNDSEGYDCEADITVGNVSYSRDMKDNQWGTLCLPFSINPNAYSDCSFYQLNSVDSENSEIVLSRIDDSTISAGTPVLVRRNAAVSGISISTTNTAMSNAILTGSKAGDYSLVGTLTTSNALANNCYIINNDKFWNVGDLIKSGKATTVKVGAFRSYLKANTPSAPAKMLSLSIGGDDTTAIDVLNAADDGEAEIYDLNGHRLPDLQKGVNIIKRGNKTTKVIIK